MVELNLKLLYSNYVESVKLDPNLTSEKNLRNKYFF